MSQDLQNCADHIRESGITQIVVDAERILDWSDNVDRVWDALGKVRMAFFKGDREKLLDAIDRTRHGLFGDWPEKQQAGPTRE